ncbi:MAG TPA: hypothetical protein ENJ89_04625, partial [Caldithrix abyssi]|nr:hypothetical protein [Caldithrix abyssi]
GGFILYNVRKDWRDLFRRLQSAMRWDDDYHQRELAPAGSQLRAFAMGRRFIPISKVTFDNRYHSILFGEIYAQNKTGQEDIHRALLRRWLASGAQALSETDGAFLLLVWDDAEQKLFIANDAFGLFPLNYANRPDGFFFASQLTALATLLNRAEFDEQALAERMFLGFPLNGRTYLKDVRRLPPGSLLEFRDGHVNVSRYFRPMYDYQTRRPLQERLRAVEQLFASAVQKRYRPDERAAIALSGGFDTRLIWSVALNKGLDAAAATHGASRSADMVIARQIAAGLKLPHSAFDLDALPAQQFPDWSEELIRMSDGLMPASAFFIIPYYRFLQQNFDVLIDGAGGALYRRQHAATFEWQQKRGLSPESFTFRLFLKPAFKHRDLFPAWKQDFTEPIRQELSDYFTRTSPLGAPADRIDLFYLQQIVGLLYSADFLLQTHFINCREPFYDLQLFAAGRTFSPQERKKLFIHRHIIERNFPALTEYPLEFQDYALPYRGFLWKRMTAAATDRFHLPFAGRRLQKFPPLFDQAAFLRRHGRDYLFDLLLASGAQTGRRAAPKALEKILNEHFGGTTDHTGLLFQLLGLELTLRLFNRLLTGSKL